MTTTERESERGTSPRQKSEELGILESMQTGGFEIVQIGRGARRSRLRPGPRGTRSSRWSAGYCLGILLAFVVDRLDRRIKTTDTLEKEFGLPVLASIPRVGRLLVPDGNCAFRRACGLLRHIPRFVESFRSLRIQSEVLRVRPSDPHHRRHQWASARRQDRHHSQSGRQPGSLRRPRRGDRSRPAPAHGPSLFSA